MRAKTIDFEYYRNSDSQIFLSKLETRYARESARLGPVEGLRQVIQNTRNETPSLQESIRPETGQTKQESELRIFVLRKFSEYFFSQPAYRQFQNNLSLYLFGSVARLSFPAGSDFDCFVVVDAPHDSIKNLLREFTKAFQQAHLLNTHFDDFYIYESTNLEKMLKPREGSAVDMHPLPKFLDSVHIYGSQFPEIKNTEDLSRIPVAEIRTLFDELGTDNPEDSFYYRTAFKINFAADPSYKLFFNIKALNRNIDFLMWTAKAFMHNHRFRRAINPLDYWGASHLNVLNEVEIKNLKTIYRFLVFLRNHPDFHHKDKVTVQKAGAIMKALKKMDPVLSRDIQEALLLKDFESLPEMELVFKENIFKPMLKVKNYLDTLPPD